MLGHHGDPATPVVQFLAPGGQGRVDCDPIWAVSSGKDVGGAQARLQLFMVRNYALGEGLLSGWGSVRVCMHACVYVCACTCVENKGG